MCGIVGAATQRNSLGILLEGLRRLEYRGYDSSGVAVLSGNAQIQLVKAVGKVKQLETMLDNKAARGAVGIAHTRWATHGEPSVANAHPHVSGTFAVVHNGIIENHEALRNELLADAYVFQSQTDTEVIAHLLHRFTASGLSVAEAFSRTLVKLQGAYALAVICETDPEKIYIARKGSPLVVGLGIEENFVASDQLALRPVTDRFMFLDDGDYGYVSKTDIVIFNINGAVVNRPVKRIEEDSFDASKGEFKHFMLKEIFEQPDAIRRTLSGRLGSSIDINSFGSGAYDLFNSIESVQIVACGTSYHAGLVAKYWLEEYVNLPVMVEIASEFRYRNTALLPNCLFITISQSGETADTLAALIKAKALPYLSTLAVCNVDNSSLVRSSDLSLLTKAGAEIGVASTKAFTTQLTALLLLVGAIGQVKGKLDLAGEVAANLQRLPAIMGGLLQLDDELKTLSADFAHLHHALFLGRGSQHPVAMEGALKLKEISYIHAEAYAAGELKHGPLALVDEDMPVIAVAPNNDVLDKIKSNIEEVKARGGRLYVFADEGAGFSTEGSFTTVINMPHVAEMIAPIAYSLPLQLLAYHVAIVKGTDVDQPRNLAKSVTVE